MEKIFADIKKGIVAPCYLLYGDEEYLINENLDRIIEALVPQPDRDFSLFHLEGEETDIETLINALQEPSLLGGRKVIVAKNTSVFASRQNATDIIPKIIANIEDNPASAAKHFFLFLKLTGFTPDDLQNDGWKKISDEQWQQAVGGEKTGQEREKWLPHIIDICAELGPTAAKTADKTQELEEIAQKYFSADNCVIFTAQAVDKRKRFFKVVEAMGRVIYFGRTKKEARQKDALIKEARQVLDKSGKKMTPEAWTALGKKTGWEMRQSVRELEKLIIFTGNSQTIRDSDVEEAVGKTKEESVFELTSSLSEKNTSGALAALKALFDQGTHHLIILSMLVREVRLLLQARILLDENTLPPFKSGREFGWFKNNIYPALSQAKEGGSSSGLIFTQHPFVVYNAWKNCGRFSYESLVGFLDDLLEIDRSFKSSAADPKLILESFLIRACIKAC
ncbi:MAG TPA: DNA polymerase III subunit delta [Deltaproteobacteria bacterium]|nr:DNA polymerase III subunit delta [Deltaproteobacteria bacterium]